MTLNLEQFKQLLVALFVQKIRRFTFRQTFQVFLSRCSFLFTMNIMDLISPSDVAGAVSDFMKNQFPTMLKEAIGKELAGSDFKSYVDTEVQKYKEYFEREIPASIAAFFDSKQGKLVLARTLGTYIERNGFVPTGISEVEKNALIAAFWDKYKDMLVTDTTGEIVKSSIVYSMIEDIANAQVRAAFLAD